MCLLAFCADHVDPPPRFCITHYERSFAGSFHLSSHKQRLIYPDGSVEKYCSVPIMLGKTAEATHEGESVEVT
jgi:hypothetical protein